MTEIDVNIYKVVKYTENVLGIDFYTYSIEKEHLMSAEELLDYGRENKYNSQLESSGNIFVNDELGAFKYAYERNLDEMQKLVTYINNSIGTVAVDTQNSVSSPCKYSRLDPNIYHWKLVRLNPDGVIKLCKRRTGENKMYADSLFIADTEMQAFLKVASYDSTKYRSHITTKSPAYKEWSLFIDSEKE